MNTNFGKTAEVSPETSQILVYKPVGERFSPVREYIHTNQKTQRLLCNMYPNEWDIDKLHLIRSYAGVFVLAILMQMGKFH
jgi:hypothetical protein